MGEQTLVKGKTELRWFNVVIIIVIGRSDLHINFVFYA